MSDLTLPPLTLVPMEPLGAASSASGAAGPAWPMPPAGRYRSLPPPAGGMACELEGLNGRTMRVLLTRLDLQHAWVEVVSPGLRAPMQLRFAQFRRLALQATLEPEGPIAADLVQSYRLRSRTGTDRNGLTVGHVDTAAGVFLFEPQDNRGSVRCVFVPSTAYESLTIGGRLVQGHATGHAAAGAGAPATAASRPATPAAPPAPSAPPTPASPSRPPAAPLAARSTPQSAPGGSPGVLPPLTLPTTTAPSTRTGPSAAAAPATAPRLPEPMRPQTSAPVPAALRLDPASGSRPAAPAAATPAAPRAGSPVMPAAPRAGATPTPPRVPEPPGTSPSRAAAAPTAVRHVADVGLRRAATPAPEPPSGRPDAAGNAPPLPSLAGAGLDLAPPWPTVSADPPAPPRPTPVQAQPAAPRGPSASAELPPLTLDLDFPALADTPAPARPASPVAGAQTVRPAPERRSPSAPPSQTAAARRVPPGAAAAPSATGAAASRPAEPSAAADALRGKPVATADDLLLAVERQAKMPMLRMGEALIALGHIDQQQLEAALAAQKADHNVPLGEILVRSGAIRRNDLQQAMVRKMGYPVVDLEQFAPDTEALAKVSYALAARLEVLPLLLHGGRLYVAMEDPTRGKVIDELEFASGCKLVPALAPQGRLAAAIDACYQKMGAETGLRSSQPAGDGDTPDAAELLASLESEGADRAGSEDDRSIEQSDNSLVRLINQMILEAQAMGVSDIHIESQPGREKVRIRFRRDGVLRPYMELPHTYRNALLARIKIMCDLDISEKRKPQDGKIAFGKFHAGSRLELRVATIPTAGGLEDAVLRLLASARPLPLDEIGLSPRNLPLIKGIVERPYGMFLCVGPTGSGKTTTLHSALGFINRPERKIWTAEDPIEITQPGLRQVQVNPKIELTFARALRAFLRADPDVIMVGEIRDKETASVAVESSLTGHLVLSTLHTNSAPETVTRLLDMGMDPFNFADALLGVLAQRLVRRICSGCRTSREATPAEIEEMLADYRNAFGHAEKRPSEDDVLAGWRERFGLDGRLHHYHGSGCDKCGGSGLRGRAGIHELMTVTREIRRLIQTGARAEELQKTAMADGMLTLRQDGIEKVLQGVTTLGEVRSSSN